MQFNHRRGSADALRNSERSTGRAIIVFERYCYRRAKILPSLQLSRIPSTVLLPRAEVEIGYLLEDENDILRRKATVVLQRDAEDRLKGIPQRTEAKRLEKDSVFAVVLAAEDLRDTFEVMAHPGF